MRLTIINLLSESAIEFTQQKINNIYLIEAQAYKYGRLIIYFENDNFLFSLESGVIEWVKDEKFTLDWIQEIKELLQNERAH